MKSVPAVPYKGSKRKIAKEILSCIPSARYFVDAMGGGGAMTAAALLSDKFDHVLMNDIEPGLVDLFRRAVLGDFSGLDVYSFVNRDEFFRDVKDSAYIRFIWSFGNDGRTYLYSKEKEPFKRALHNVVCYDDYMGLTPYNLLIPKLTKNTVRERRLEMAELIYDYAPAELVQKFGNEMHRLAHLERLDSLNELMLLSELPSFQTLRFSSESYENLEKYTGFDDDNCVYYYDIPYENTSKYNVAFDKNAFCEHIRQQKHLSFISEYTMPSDFVCIKEIDHRATICASTNNIKTKERVFVHESMLDRLKMKKKTQNTQ